MFINNENKAFVIVLPMFNISCELRTPINSIIAVTADATDAARQKVMDVGMDNYITKPVNRKIL